MLIVIHLDEARVHLRDPDDFTRFSVAVEGSGDAAALAAVVEESGLGRLRGDGEHVVVNPVALRSLAGSTATEPWGEGLAGMCAYAAARGWMEDDGGVVAHIERGVEAG